MITTRFGTEVRILKDMGDGQVEVRTTDGRVRTWPVNRLRATNGYAEIKAELDKLTQGGNDEAGR